MGYLFLVIVSGIFLSGYFAGVDAAVGASATTCTAGGSECDALNHEVCATDGSFECICDTGYTDNSGTCGCGDPSVSDATIALAGGATATNEDDTATVTCVTGYEVSGGGATAAITCLADGSWDGLPTCSKKDCGAVSNPANGDTIVYFGGVTTYGTSATVTCDDESTQTLTCESSGSWSAVPTCPGCGDPSAPADATVALDTSDVTDPAATATVTCATGYEVSGGAATATITCQAGGSWTAVTCSKKDCGAVSDPTNGATVLDSDGVMTYQATATVNCDDGSSQTITCESSGSWSVLPTCPAGCGDPAAPADATVALAIADTTGTGADATVTCVTGYEVSGAATATITCQNDGTWTAATCSKKDCGAVSNPGDGTTTLDSAGVTTYEATSTVTCNAGFGLDTNTATATITCQADTDWSALPACTSGDAANCGAPTAPENGVISTAATANTEGHEATVACDTGYTLDGSSTMTCQYDNSWSTPGTCSGATSVAWSFYVLLLLGVMTRLMKE